MRFHQTLHRYVTTFPNETSVVRFMERRDHVRPRRETHDVSLREGSTDDVFSVACVCGFSLAERDAPDTSGDTLQLRGEHTEKTSQDFPLRISH